MENEQSVNSNEKSSKSKKGGSRKNAGRKPIWGEARCQISMWQSGQYTLMRFLEDCHKNKIKGEKFDAILDFARLAMTFSSSNFTMDYYANPVSAGPGRTSTAGSGSSNADYENINVQHLLSPNPQKSFMVPVVGDSMKEARVIPVARFP